MEKLTQEQFAAACISGNSSSVQNLDVTAYKLTPEIVHKMAKKGSYEHRKIFDTLLTKGVIIPTDERLLLRCCKNKWRKTTIFLAARYDSIGNLQDPKCIIKLIKLDSVELNRMILTKNLAYMGEHEKVMVFLCSTGRVDLVRVVVNITYIDPLHNKCVFLKAAGKNEEMSTILMKYTTNKEDLQRYLAVRSVI